MSIPFIDFKTQYKSLKKDIEKAVADVMSDAHFIQGPQVSLFEKEFAKYLNVRYCISVNSGTDALILGMRALDLPVGSEVIVPVNTFIATALGASENDLKPVFVDIDPDDYGMDLVDLKKKISAKTKVIVVVHLYGQPDKIDEIKKIIKETGRTIYLVEDACQAHGALYKGKKVGTFGIFSAFSFYPGKNLGAYGDGGAIVTDDPNINTSCRTLCQYGQKKKYFHESVGVNSRLDTLQAAFLRVKLPHLNNWNEKRRTWAAYYTKKLNVALPTIKTPSLFANRVSACHLYVIEVAKRDGLLEYLKKQGIIALIHYPIPLHLQKAYISLGYKKGDFPFAEAIASRIISLPLHPDLTRQHVDFVVSSIKKFYER